LEGNSPSLDKKPMRKAIIIFLLVIILPTVLFLIYQVDTLKENESVIESIYNNQLDAILFSINQYSEDAVSSWANKLNKIFNEQDQTGNENINSIISELPSVTLLVRFSEKGDIITQVPASRDFIPLVGNIATTLEKNDTTIRRLQSYLKGGYRKIQSYELDSNGLQLLVFLDESKTGVIINSLVIDPRQFVNKVLDPKIQEIAQDKFYITAFYKTENNIIYNSNKKNQIKQPKHFKPFWLLSDYYVGIELKDRTINDVARERSLRNIYLIVFIDLILMAGAWLIYRNIKRQIELSRLKSDFVSNVSHEIRTPLALISMYIETLEMGRIKSEEKVKEYYSVIFHEAQRLSGIVNKILNFSQIENGKRN
jgi:two-component system, OmpR family, phosphate regulon sensor histidine kinase PhoR